MWVARARAGSPRAEFVLDAIVERKSVADLLGSVKGGRYEKQKYLLRRCGLRRLIYLIEGVPEAETAGVRSPHPQRKSLVCCCKRPLASSRCLYEMWLIVFACSRPGLVKGLWC